MGDMMVDQGLASDWGTGSGTSATLGIGWMVLGRSSVSTAAAPAELCGTPTLQDAYVSTF